MSRTDAGKTSHMTIPAGGSVAAEAAARAAAAASGVEVRDLTALADAVRMCALFGEIWGPAPGSQPAPVELLRILGHTGNYVSGAFAGDELVGGCAGFLAAPAGVALHSHVAGVSARVAGRHVGFALKLHQRAWALARGLSEITWTFDPLVRRNAYFNLGKLAAAPAGYLPDFYGPIDDGINAGDETDRLLARWALADPAVARACAGVPAGCDAAALRAAGAAVALDAGASGGPAHPGGGAGGGAEVVLVRVPADIEAMRRDSPKTALAWRHAVREVLGGLLAGGGRVSGFDRSGWYAVAPGPRAGGEEGSAW
jgi:predicted GNAT superfamily acetyltransferase